MRRGGWIAALGLALAGCGNDRLEARSHRNLPSIEPRVTVAESGRDRLDVRGIRNDLFSSPIEEKPAPPRPFTPPLHHSTTPPPEPPDPLAGWEYVGDVEIGGERLALLERKDTKEGVYLRVGDSFAGGSVASFDKRRVAVAMADSERALARKDDWRFTNPRQGSTPENIAAYDTVVRADSLISNTAANKLLLSGKLWISGDREELKNNVFEGKMSLQDYDSQAPAAIEILTLKSTVAESFEYIYRNAN